MHVRMTQSIQICMYLEVHRCIDMSTHIHVHLHNILRPPSAHFEDTLFLRSSGCVVPKGASEHPCQHSRLNGEGNIQYTNELHAPATKHIRTHIHMHIHCHVYIHIYTYEHAHAHAHTYTYACTSTCTCTHTCVHIHIIQLFV